MAGETEDFIGQWDPACMGQKETPSKSSTPLQFLFYLVLAVLAYATFAGTDMMLSRWLQACLTLTLTLTLTCMHAPCMRRACAVCSLLLY